ncbi:MAG: Gfo/Idh/MocA family oxidoreductase [Deltaproteobacteria bacterium]|nr:Gfo/Idh/MocA family oxidoreductase [Deltaproteobacteria bacterium]
MGALGIGLIGVGRHGERYAHHLVEDFPGLRLVAIARRTPDAVARRSAELSCHGYTDYRQLVEAPDVDALIVVVPPTLHPEIIEAAAAARKPVLLEKPAAVSVEAGRRMLRQIRQAGIEVMVAQTLRFNGVVRCLLQARERIGPIHALRIGQRFEPSRPGWIDDPAIAGGGMTLHTGVHCFDLVRLLSGCEVDRVTCEMTRVGTARSEDNFAATLRLQGGTALATVAGSRATASRSGGIELAGRSGQLIGDHLLNFASEVHGTTASPFAVPPPVATVHETIAAFSTALLAHRPMPITFEEGLRAVAIAEACYRAADTAAAAAVPPID